MLTYPAYFENKFCDECLVHHWVELSRTGRQTCHGEQFQPTKASPAHYARRVGRGYELIEKKPSAQDITWQLIAESRQ